LRRGAEDDQCAIGRIRECSGENYFTTRVSLADKTKMFVAQWCATCDEIVDDFVEQSIEAYGAASALNFSLA